MSKTSSAHVSANVIDEMVKCDQCKHSMPKDIAVVLTPPTHTGFLCSPCGRLTVQLQVAPMAGQASTIPPWLGVNGTRVIDTQALRRNKTRKSNGKANHESK